MNDPYPGRPGAGSVFDEIRRQVEELLGTRQPPAPRVITTPASGPRATGDGQTNVALGATAAYWALAVAAARKRRRARRQAQAASDS